MIKNFYYKFLYRRIMKLAHKYGWHHMRTSYIEDPSNNTISTLVRCEWCGLSTITHRQIMCGNSSVDMVPKQMEK
jgi:hypothetical protein